MAVMTSALTGCLGLGVGPCWAFRADSNHIENLPHPLSLTSCAVPPRKQLEADGSLLVCVEFVKAGSADERGKGISFGFNRSGCPEDFFLPISCCSHEPFA